MDQNWKEAPRDTGLDTSGRTLSTSKKENLNATSERMTTPTTL